MSDPVVVTPNYPAIASQGTTLTFNSTAVGKLTSIGEVNVQADEIDVTTLDTTGGYKEYLQGFKDSGEVALEGFLGYHGNTGQAALNTAFASGEAKATVITFPDGSTLTFNSWVKAVKFGNAEVNGAVKFGATLRITGAVTYAAGS